MKLFEPACLCLSQALCCGHSSTDAPLIANINARQTISLDGEWRTIVDPCDVGLSRQTAEGQRRILQELQAAISLAVG
jgi:hypothetical protein